MQQLIFLKKACPTARSLYPFSQTKRDQKTHTFDLILSTPFSCADTFYAA